MPRFDDRPVIVIWEVTRACALACVHCRAEAMACADPGQLSTEEAFGLLDQVARCAPQVLVLTGGDPMERADLLDVVQAATDRGLRVALSPSATPRFCAADLGTFARAGVQRISLSLDGATEASHDAFRGVPGTWAWTMQAVDAIRAAGIELQLNTTLSRRNAHELEAFFDVVGRLHPTLWSVFVLVPTGRATTDDALDATELEALFERLANFAAEAPFGIKTTEGQHYRRVEHQRWLARGRNGPRPSPMGLGDGKGFVFVSHTGEICPSGFLPLVAGNVRHDDLLDVYRSAPLFQALRDPDRLGGKCGWCEYRALCGGSRARAWALTGDPLGADPSCAYEPARRGAPLVDLTPAGPGARPAAR